MMDLLFTNATIVTMDDACPVMHKAFLGVENGRIVYLSDAAPETDAKVIKDMEGRILMPGLINTHGHLGMGCLRGYADDYALQPWLYEHVFPAEGRMDARAVLAGVKLGLLEMTAHGITSVTDMYRYEPDAARLTEKAGLRGNFCNAVLTLDPEHFELEKDGAYTEFIEMMESCHGLGNGRIKAEVGIHAEYTSTPKQWKQMVELAKAYGVGIHLHLSETKTEHEEAIGRWGKTPAQILSESGVFEVKVNCAHGVWVDEKDGELLAQAGATVAHCPVSNLKLGSGVAPIARLIDQGVNVALGTDSVCSNNVLDLFDEMKLAALLAKGTSLKADVIPAWQALKMATVNGAKAQGRENEVGKLCVGMEADIIAIDGRKLHLRPGQDVISTLVYCASGQDVCMTMVQGEILYEDGQFFRLDAEAILREVEEYALPKAAGTI